MDDGTGFEADAAKEPELLERLYLTT